MMGRIHDREYIDRVRDNCNIENILYFLGLEYSEPDHKNWIKFVCPFHEDTHPSCAIEANAKMFHCWSCGEKGDIFKLVGHILHISFYKSVKMVAKWSGIEYLNIQDNFELNKAKFEKIINNEQKNKNNINKIDIIDISLNTEFGNYISDNPDELEDFDNLFMEFDRSIKEKNMENILNIQDNILEEILKRRKNKMEKNNA